MQVEPFLHGFEGMCSVDVAVHADGVDGEDKSIRRQRRLCFQAVEEVPAVLEVGGTEMDDLL